jgi:hypothetical protein
MALLALQGCSYVVDVAATPVKLLLLPIEIVDSALEGVKAVTKKSAPYQSKFSEEWFTSGPGSDLQDIYNGCKDSTDYECFIDGIRMSRKRGPNTKRPRKVTLSHWMIQDIIAVAAFTEREDGSSAITWGDYNTYDEAVPPVCALTIERDAELRVTKATLSPPSGFVAGSIPPKKW